MPGERQAKRKVSMPRTIGMVIFRILAIGVWIFALLIFVGGLSTDFLTCTIIALIISFIGWMLWVIGDMIHDPEKIRAEQRAARAAKDPSIVLDEDSERERKRAANGHWDGRANPGHAQPNDEASPALVGVEVEDGEALASARRETGQSSALSRTISLSPIIIPPKTLSVSATRETETVSGSYPATIYVYDPRPILKLKEGRAEKISVVTRPITLKSRLNGRQWRSGVDDGYAVEYKGKPFGVLFNHIAVIHIRAILESDAKKCGTRGHAPRMVPNRRSRNLRHGANAGRGEGKRNWQRLAQGIRTATSIWSGCGRRNGNIPRLGEQLEWS